MTTFDKAIEVARGLLGDGEFGSEYDRALVEFLCDAFPIEGITDMDAKRDHVKNLLLAVPTKDYTFESLAGGEGEAIMLRPYLDPKGQLLWELYIPPTTKDAFECGEDEGDFDPTENDIAAPYGETYWDSLSGAVASLSMAVRQGAIKFNDGRVAT